MARVLWEAKIHALAAASLAALAIGLGGCLVEQGESEPEDVSEVESELAPGEIGDLGAPRVGTGAEEASGDQDGPDPIPWRQSGAASQGPAPGPIDPPITPPGPHNNDD